LTAAALTVAPTRRWPIAALLAIALALAWPLIVGPTFLLYIGTLVAMYSIGAMSLHLVFRTGQVSLGHAAFMGIGGYGSVLLTAQLGLPWPLAFLAGSVIAGLAGLAVGPIVLRLRGVYFSLFTFTFGEFVRLVFVEWTSLTGGSEGIAAIPSPAPFTTPTGFYYLALGLALACFLFCHRLLSSSLGEAVDAVRESESLAQSNGIPVLRTRLLVFAIACAMVGLQGALEATFVHYVSPLSYAFAGSLRFLVINIIGGLTSLWGPVLGSVFIVALPELLRSWVDYQWVFYGITLIVVMRYLPGGLFELGQRGATLLRRGSGR
jgi:branched-chain amino acid transport system permease protein